MNSKNKILVGCLALLLVLSVGYALFSDTITINGTATAKGDFAYEITTTKGIDESVKVSTMHDIYNYSSSGDTFVFEETSGVENSTISSSGNTISVSIDFTLPGQIQYYTAKITNTGTIPITFDPWADITPISTINGNLIMDDDGLVDVNDVENFVLGNITSDYKFSGVDEMSISQIKAGVISIDKIVVSESVWQKLELDENAMPIIESGDSIYIVLQSIFNPNFNERVKGYDLTAESTISLPIKQITN